MLFHGMLDETHLYCVTVDQKYLAFYYSVIHGVAVRIEECSGKKMRIPVPVLPGHSTQLGGKRWYCTTTWLGGQLLNTRHWLLGTELQQFEQILGCEHV